MNSIDEWVEEFQKNVFNECAKQHDNKSESNTEFSSVSQMEYVSISLIVEYIQKSFLKPLPFFRNQNEFLQDIRKCLQKNSACKVNWIEFKELSTSWFKKLFELSQDGNNNVRANYRYVSTEFPKRNMLHSMKENHCNDTMDDDNSCTINQTDTVASLYIVNSTDAELSVSNVASPEESENINDITTAADPKRRIERMNEEIAFLNDEISNLEEANKSLNSLIKEKQNKLDQVVDKLSGLQKEFDNQKEILNESNQREKTWKENSLKLERQENVLKKKIEELERHKENIENLNIKIKELTQNNLKWKQHFSEIIAKYEDKSLEYDYLHEQFTELQYNNIKLKTDFEKTNEEQQEKIIGLQNLNLELQSKINKSDSSSQFSTTPPSYNYFSTRFHSTPCSISRKIRDVDSLYSELKESGFYVDNHHAEDSKEKFLIYEEISNIENVVDKALKEITASRKEICIPNLEIKKTDSIENLKYKITTLINLVTSCETFKESSMSRRAEDSPEKPDVLPETKKTNSLVSDRAFASKKWEDGVFNSGGTSLKSLLSNEVHSTCDKSISAIMETSNSSKKVEVFKANKEEVIIPRTEALNRIIELKGSNNTDEIESITHPEHKHKSKYTNNKDSDFPNTVSKTRSTTDSSCIKSTNECLNSQSYINGKGDGPHNNIDNINECNNQTYQISATPDKLKSSFKKYNISNDKFFHENDMKYVTVRPNDETFLLKPIVSSSVGNVGSENFIADLKSENINHNTPVHNKKMVPHRKLSVYNPPSLGIDSLPSPDSAPNTSDEIKPLYNSTNIHKIEYTGCSKKLPLSLESSIIKDQQSTTLSQYVNNMDSSDSSSSKMEVSRDRKITNDSINLSRKLNNSAFTPPKMKFDDSIFNQTSKMNQEFNLKPSILINRNSGSETFSENIAAQQSKISSLSSNIVKKEIQKEKCNNATSLYSYSSNTSNLCVTNPKKNDQTYIKAGGDASAEGRQEGGGATVAATSRTAGRVSTATTAASAASAASASASAAAAAAAAAAGVGASAGCRSGVEVSTTVGRAMSSGEEESSAESECETARVTEESGEIDPESQSLQNVASQGDKVELLLNGNSLDSEDNNQKITLNSSSIEAIKDDEIPKAFPSWTDEKLQEFGIASFPDIDSETTEILSEDELKKKYTAFSIGLNTDKMTLPRRSTLSRRQRDQAEKNCRNEVSKMYQDIKELAPLCVDSESVERVERVKLQLDMVTRCVHRISCSAETLGAVHQERRVSRAVLLADKYMQTLRTKCEKLAAELAETKRILAENNIVLEENLSELGDDFPRVRYRGVPNNNRTMMARRRASIAAISRPLMGSNQDISKELPRQRNSVSGRVPGTRRPSLCFETPKWEIEKLDRTDSSSSIAEMREIFEHTESRRQSQEENNNLVRLSLKNLSTNTSEYIEGEEHWSNSREDILPESSNDNETVSVESRQSYGHPIVSWLFNKYVTWKPMLWCILIAFLLGFFINHMVSSSKREGPPLSWWSIEEILNQYIQVNNGKRHIPRPI